LRPPRKRRELQRALDRWIAEWLASDDLTPAQRSMLEEEREQRKRTRKREQRAVGLIMPVEGYTKPQFDRLPELLAGATRILHHGVPSRVHQLCRRVAPVTVHNDQPRTVVTNADLVIALTKETTVMPHATPGVWKLIGLAKHRSVPVRVILPDGTEPRGDQ
jgi:hypothetical protein